MIVLVVAPVKRKLQGGSRQISSILAENVVDHRLKLPRLSIIFNISHL